MGSLWRRIMSRSPRPTSPANPPLPAAAAHASPAGLQGRLWNQAYDELKADEPKIVDAYEKFLSTELPTANETEPEPRWHLMERLVRVGLQKTAREATGMQQIGEVIQTVGVVRGLVDKAVQASPEAAIAWVGVSFALEVLSKPLTEPGINRKGLSYVVARMDWYWNLVDLLLDERAFNGLRGQLETCIVKLYQKLLLYQMRSVCLYHRNRIAVFLRDMVVLDDWDGQINDIKLAEAAVWRDSEQYNSQQVRSHLEGIAGAAERQFSELQGITSAIYNQTRLQEQAHQDEKDEKCLQDLYDTDPIHDKTRIQDTKGSLLRDSYAWVLDNPNFKRWRTDARGLFWIRGDPGKGKTMLLCGIIDELEKDSANPLAYFFCQATEQKLNTATAVLRGLIYTLVRRYPPLISHARKEYDGGGKHRFEGPNAWEVMSKILITMLSDPILDAAVLIVDALDECGAYRPQLLDFIIRVSASSRTKWIVSSRNWPDIREKLAATAQVTLCLELNEDSISEAVRVYIRHKVSELAQLKGYNKTTRDAVHRHFTENSNNTFLWVALVCQELANPKTRKWHAINALKSFPPGLDALYQRMMEHIGDSNDADLCKQILAVVSVAYRPVTLAELVSLVDSLASFDDDLESVIASCGSFLTLRRGIVYFVHQSAKDFLLDQASRQILPDGIAHQHRAIFSRSVEVLSRILHRDMYHLVAPGSSIDNVPRLDPDPLAPARYSCVHWVDHLQDAERAEELTLEHLQDGGLVHVFLQRKYLYWLEAMSLQGSMSQAVLAVRKLKTLRAMAGAPELTEFIQDAHRFILSHKGVLQIAPLQLYTSALVFSPFRSLVKKGFEEAALYKINITPAIEADWNACVQTLEGHSLAVRSVAFSPDGQRLVSASLDKAVKVWDVATGTCVQTFQGHNAAVLSVALSTDGQRIASASRDKTVKVWNAATGACVRTLEGHSAAVWSVAFSADGQRLASASRDKTVKVWNATTGDCVNTLRGHGDGVWSVAFSTDGQRLASASRDRTVKVWNTAMGACVQTLNGHGETVSSVDFSANAEQIASASTDKTVKVWNAAMGTSVQTLEDHSLAVRSVAFSPDSQWLASASEDKTVKVWDVDTGTCVKTFEGHSAAVLSVAFSADSQWLASASEDKTVKLWDVVTGACAQNTRGHGATVMSMTFSPDGHRLASASEDNTVKVWDVVTGACIQTRGHGAMVMLMAFSADGQQLALGSNDNTVMVLQIATGRYVHMLEAHSSGVTSVAFSTDGQRLASASRDKTVKVWKAATGACVQTLKCEKPVTCLYFGADTNTILSTDIGVLSPDSSSLQTQTLQASAKEPRYHGYGVSPDNVWVVKDSEKLLWLPSEYRPSASAVIGSTIALGCPSGRVLTIQFSTNVPLQEQPTNLEEPILEYDVSSARSLWPAIADSCKKGVENAAGTRLSWWPLSDPEGALMPGYTRVYSMLFTRHRRFYDDIPTSVAETLFPKLVDARLTTSKPRWAALGRDAVYLKDSTPLHLLRRRDDRYGQFEPLGSQADGCDLSGVDSHNLALGLQVPTRTASYGKQQSGPIIFISGDIARNESVALAVNLGEDDKATMQNLRAASGSLSSWRWKRPVGVQFYRFQSFHQLADNHRQIELHNDKQRYPDEAHPEYERYVYKPSPWRDGHPCPCPSGEAWFFFQHPEECGTSKHLNDALPVRLSDAADSHITAWGIYIEQRYSVLVIAIPVLAIYFVTIAATMWFVFWWLNKHPNDLQGATVPISLAMAMVTSFINTAVCLLLFRWGL